MRGGRHASDPPLEGPSTWAPTASGVMAARGRPEGSPSLSSVFSSLDHKEILPYTLNCWKWRRTALNYYLLIYLKC